VFFDCGQISVAHLLEGVSYKQNTKTLMQLQLVNSSAIIAIGFDGYTLTVAFHNGRTYDHPGVPYDVYAGLMQASSKGRYYNRYIRGRYR